MNNVIPLTRRQVFGALTLLTTTHPQQSPGARLALAADTVQPERNDWSGMPPIREMLEPL